ncbi:hypothetical protein GCM10023074_60140 [Microbispora amethystogenes]|uniref:Uncharacterized protein n=1 Tax=Microbispora amethystogenes TaxID=1427754 RepID=A0ABQ4FN65_9ACTN|nr:hypothetical protein Mam01_64150 [Microbispora amethystogenes]
MATEAVGGDHRQAGGLRQFEETLVGIIHGLYKALATPGGQLTPIGFGQETPGEQALVRYQVHLHARVVLSADQGV